MNAHGTDVSRYQHPENYALGKSRGLSFAVHRGTVGNYYTDAALLPAFNGYKAQGLLSSVYLVTAPRNYDGGQRISAQAHLERFFNAVATITPDMSFVVDAELARGETKDYITQLIKDVVIGIYAATNKYPIIYTRQTWWDTYVNPDPIWVLCDLWAARYNSVLTGPWSDGYCKFRDWNEWKFWQYTSHADGIYYGFNSLNGDLDWFNGTEDNLYDYAHIARPVLKVDIIWRELQAHYPDWNYQP